MEGSRPGWQSTANEEAMKSGGRSTLTVALNQDIGLYRRIDEGGAGVVRLFQAFENAKAGFAGGNMVPARLYGPAVHEDVGGLGDTLHLVDGVFGPAERDANRLIEMLVLHAFPPERDRKSIRESQFGSHRGDLPTQKTDCRNHFARIGQMADLICLVIPSS